MKIKVKNQGESQQENKKSFLKRWFAPLYEKKQGKKHKNKFFAFMQQLGGTFMLPISVLAVAGILLGIGSAFSSKSFFETIGVGYESKGVSVVVKIFQFVQLSGDIFFSMIPLAFCMAIPIGFCSANKGVAVFAAFLAFFGVIVATNWFINAIPVSFKNTLLNSGGIKGESIGLFKNKFGLKYGMDINILGGIIVGLMVTKLHEQFQYIKLPTAFNFFGGKRFVPVISLLLSTFLGIIFALTWPWIGKGLYYFGKSINKLGVFGPGIFMFTSRLLCPTGLHHMLNSLFNYTAVGNTWTSPQTGEVFNGNFNIALEQIKEGIGVQPNIGKWLSGSYLVPIAFGLPAAAIAMYLTAKKENRLFVRGVIISGIVATALGGITETIEFLFLFVSPLLYLFHAFMVGLGYVVWGAFGGSMAGGGDFFTWMVYGPLQGLKTKWWLVFPMGAVSSTVYFVVFYFSIKKFNIKTIGRGDRDLSKSSALFNTGAKTKNRKKNKKNKNIVDENAKEYKQAMGVLKLVGGFANIKTLTNCFSRLRMTLNKPKKITDSDVKSIGGIGLKRISDTSYQIVIGMHVEDVKRAINQIGGLDHVSNK